MGFSPPLAPQEVQDAFVDYEVLATVQTGGQGAVFKARRVAAGLTEIVALKVYHEDQLEERLEREMLALKRLSSPTLTKLCDAGSRQIRGTPCRYLATTFVEGITVEQLIKRDGALSLAICARIGHDVSVATDILWGERIVHRDIKPNNVMFDEHGGAVLIDLGVARHLNMNSLTTAGKTWGTEGYLSPEQARGLPLSCKSDVFAIGLLLQQCLLGRHPTMYKQALLLNGGPSTNTLKASIPVEFARLVDAMVHRSALHRPTPTQAASALSAFWGART